MDAGIKARDAAMIRDAASKATALGRMVDGEAAEKVEAAIKDARAAAREIVKVIKTRSIDVEEVILETNTRALEEARFAFLNFSQAPVVPLEEALPAVEARALSLEVLPEMEVPEEALELVEPITVIEKVAVEEAYDDDGEMVLSQFEEMNVMLRDVVLGEETGLVS